MKKMDKKSETRSKLLDAAFIEVYVNGYHGASTAAILKIANTPKGSMYHFFPSKKALVLAVIKERIFPKMDYFFDFTYQNEKSVLQTIEQIFQNMGQHAFLIQNGCPMYRLMVEMAPLDEDFNKILNEHFKQFTDQLSELLKKAIELNEFNAFDTEGFSRFMITSTWGALSVSPSLSSRKNFEQHYNLILDLLKTKISH